LAGKSRYSIISFDLIYNLYWVRRIEFFTSMSFAHVRFGPDARRALIMGDLALSPESEQSRSVYASQRALRNNIQWPMVWKLPTYSSQLGQLNRTVALQAAAIRVSDIITKSLDKKVIDLTTRVDLSERTR